MMTLYFVFISAGITIPIKILVIGYGLPLLFGKVAFIFPGGVGVIESSMAALFSSLGIPKTETIMVVLIYRIISFWLPLLVGFLMTPYFAKLSARDHFNHERA